MSGDVQLDLWMNEYELDALAAVLARENTTVVPYTAAVALASGNLCPIFLRLSSAILFDTGGKSVVIRESAFCCDIR